jgi:hypothetical protein
MRAHINRLIAAAHRFKGMPYCRNSPVNGNVAFYSRKRWIFPFFQGKKNIKLNEIISYFINPAILVLVIFKKRKCEKRKMREREEPSAHQDARERAPHAYC